MAINWFPGHMHKARKDIKKSMKKVDLIIEILDARIPFSSQNPLVPGLRGIKPCLKVLNKSDLADPVVTDQWLTWLQQEQGVTAVALHRRQIPKAKGLLQLGRSLLPPERSKSRPVTAMILGIPNVGKSTIINILAGRAIAKTGNVPAVTKMQQRIELSHQFTLMDTPGFLWPKLDPPECGYRLAITGAIKDSIVEFEDIAMFAVRYFREAYPEQLQAHFKLKTLPEEPHELLEAIGARRGCLRRGGIVDMHRASEILLNDFQAGKIGRISLETPAGLPSEE
jgi:ribosome biogenesis GTPase A